MPEYPILDNRPIDQWKVTELREELRRRKLSTKGLKEELVKRLDEAICNERELLKEEELESNVQPESEAQDTHEGEALNPIDNSQAEEEMKVAVADDERKMPESEVTMVDIDVKVEDSGQATEVEHEPMIANSQATEVEHEPMVAADQATEVEHEPLITAGQATEVKPEPTAATGQATEVEHEPMVAAGQATEVEHEPMVPANQDGDTVETVALGSTMEEDVSHIELVVSKSDANGEDCRDDVENKDTKLPTEDTTSNLFEPENQVSEISPDSGFQVKCESISTDSVSINEKIELKDNLNANNFHLELDVVKPEMVQPSSSDVAPVADDFNPLDNDQEPEDNQGSVEEIEEVANATSVDLKEIGPSNGGSPEKLNLDRSSGDESMEEDVLDTKQIETNNSDEVGDTREVRELHVVKEETPVDGAVGGPPPDEDIVKEETRSVMPAEKRKLEDQGSLGTTEPVKRQRRWNAETIKIPEPQNSNQTSSTTPKDIFLSTPRRIFTRTDSGLSADSPKERFVPPSQKAVTTSLRIDRFLRPFTLKAVQELLAKTGMVCSFWMDHIKTHCYVTYSSVEEAIATRNALYNLQWPPNGGRLLIADFVDPQEVKTHVEAPESPVPVSPSTTALPAPSLERPSAPQPPPQSNRQQLPPPPTIPQPPLVSPQPPPARERERLPLPPPQKKPEPPILTLDDLFKKTRATPRIYYLPLSEEQVAAKLAAQGRSNRA